jgi:hypothetical protein
MTDVNFGRRGLLASAPWLAMLALGRPWPVRAATKPAIDSAGSAALANLLSEVDSARVVGREYLRHHPDERDPEHVQHDLTVALGGRLEAFDPAALRERVRRRVRQDFAENQITLVDGWILSNTEVRLCALAALCAGERIGSRRLCREI